MHGPTAIAVVASEVALARRASREVAIRLPGEAQAARSLAMYLASHDSPRRVVLGALGPSGAALGFLRRASDRLLWPAPAADLDEAIAGLRTPGREVAAVRHRRSRPAASALLLEGRVDTGRARAAMASGAPRDWIVESPLHVRLTVARLEGLRRAGVRWSALEPLELLAVCVSPELFRRRADWKSLIPRRTRLWVEGEDPESRTTS